MIMIPIFNAYKVTYMYCMLRSSIAMMRPIELPLLPAIPQSARSTVLVLCTQLHMFVKK